MGLVPFLNEELRDVIAAGLTALAACPLPQPQEQQGSPAHNPARTIVAVDGNQPAEPAARPANGSAVSIAQGSGSRKRPAEAEDRVQGGSRGQQDGHCEGPVHEPLRYFNMLYSCVQDVGLIAIVLLTVMMTCLSQVSPVWLLSACMAP